MEEKKLTLSEDSYQRLRIWKAKLSAKTGKALTWDDFSKVLLEKERKEEVVKSWLYTIAIFVAITLILIPFAYGIPQMIPVIFLVGFTIALFSAYILTPLSLQGVKPFTDAPPEVLNSLGELSIKAGLTKSPKLMLAKTPEINALAYASTSGSHVCVTRGLIEAYQGGKITKEELAAILGHEIGHIKNLDCLKWSFVLSWIEIFDKIGTLCIIIGLAMTGVGLAIEAVTPREKRGGGLAVAMFGWFLTIGGFITKVIAKLASILAFHLSRRQEYIADGFSAELINHEIMASALRKIDTLNDELVAKEMAALPYADRWQLQPRNPSWIDRLWDTHPPVEKRVEALTRIGEFL